MSESDGLIASYLFDGKGGGKSMNWQDIATWQPQDGPLWVHLDYKQAEAVQWITHHSGLSQLTAEALLADETRPRTADIEGGLLIILRGVNLNPGSNPEDMVAIRIWTDGTRIITTRKRRLLSITDLCLAIDNGKGPKSPGEFLVMLIDRLSERMNDVIDDIDDRVDDLEDKVLTMKSYELRAVIAHIRREAIALRRYLAPQREAMSRLYHEPIPWFEDIHRLRLRECADRIMRYIEDLDSARERAVVAQEELMSRLSEQVDKRMYVLSLVAAVFLPLGFLTGLLGINVPGIPGADYKYAFLVVSFLLIVLVITQIWIFKIKKWI